MQLPGHFKKFLRNNYINTDFNNKKMNKIFLIARREFLTRVQKKSFLLTTILLPLLIFIFYGMIIYFSVNSGEKLKIEVVDNAGVFTNSFPKSDEVEFIKGANESAAVLTTKIDKDEIDGYIIVPPGYSVNSTESIQLVSEKSIGIISREKIESILNDQLEDKRLLALNISKAQLDSIQKTKAKLQFITLKGGEDSELKAGISYGVGYVSGFLIYIILFIYGSMVMRGVMEEKVNRIAEVIVSSVKPFQLMIGKIFGIGAVGLVQFIIWIVLVLGLQLLLPLIFPDMMSGMQNNQMVTPGMNGGMQAVQNTGAMEEFMAGMSEVNWPLIIGCFIFYFLGGYLLYSSLFAAVGSSVNEDPQDAQSLMLPITMPIIFGIVIMTKAVNDPSSGLAVFGSLFPLTSPIVMMARIARGVPDPVPYSELFISMLLLIGGFIATTWLAAKIYRTGILMYGKKPSWKEMMKWAFRKS